jgi:hypothetical protein
VATLHFANTDRKVFTPISSALANLPNGAGTYVVLSKLGGATGADLTGLTASSATDWYHTLGPYGTTPFALWDDDGSSSPHAVTGQTDTTNWKLYAVDWPAGGASTERFHFRNQTTLSAWTHETSSPNNAGNRAGPGTGGWFTLGYAGDIQGVKDIAVVAAWAGTRFSDSDYGLWSKTSDLYNHPLGPPTFLCELTATTPVDLIGGSTYASGSSSGTALTGGDPVNWTFDGRGNAAPYIPHRMPLGA